MSQIFIANGTLQHHELHYRILEGLRERVVRIPAGRQECLPEEFEGASLEFVLDQLRRVGAVPASDVDSISHPYSLIYKVAPRPIAAEAIDAARERDVEVRQEIAGDKTEQAGLALLKGTEDALLRSGADPSKIAETSLEVVELNAKTDDPAKGGVDTEIVVSKKAQRKETRSRRRA